MINKKSRARAYFPRSRSAKGRIKAERSAPFGIASRAIATVVAAIGISVLTGCAEEKKPRLLTEEEIHSKDFETPSGVRGRHLYGCEDGQSLFVDFRNEGLSIELRREEKDEPRILSAPSQGLQYVGENEGATMTGNELRIVDAQGRTRVCRKQN